MFAEIADFAKNQPLLAGAGGAAIGGTLLANAKTWPRELWHLFKTQFSTELVVYSESSAFVMLDRWLAHDPSVKRMRRLTVAEWWKSSSSKLDIDDEDRVYALTPGPGSHVIWRRNRPFFVHRSIQNEGSGRGYSEQRRQTFTITTPGRSQQPIIDLLEEMRNLKDEQNAVPVFLWNGHEPYQIDLRSKRSMDTVDCEPGLKQGLIDDLTSFLSSRAAYLERGTPWRRGYLFQGPPGCGKTTMIFALASLVGRPVYIIPAQSIGNDKELLNAVNSGRNYIVVIEDIDSLRASKARDESTEDKEILTDTSRSGITSSGLLNALDGIGAQEGRVIFITTNKPEILDPRLIRPGRIDKQVHFAPATEAEVVSMFRRFHPDASPEDFLRSVRTQLPMAQAEVQSLLLTWQPIQHYVNYEVKGYAHKFQAGPYPDWQTAFEHAEDIRTSDDVCDVSLETTRDPSRRLIGEDDVN